MSDLRFNQQLFETGQFVKKLETDLKARRTTFLANIAQLNWNFPNIVEEYRKIYQVDPERYYSIAIKSAEYKSRIFSSGSLLEEIETKRMFGILLAAEEDELLRKKVSEIYYGFDRDLERLVQKPSVPLGDKILQKTIYKKGLNSVHNAAMFFAVYLLLNEYESIAKYDVMVLWGQAILGYLFSEERDGEDNTYNLDEVKDHFDYLSITDYTWKVIKDIKAYEDISALFTNATTLLGFDDERKLRDRTMYDRFLRCPNDELCKEAFYRSMTLIGAVGATGAQFGFSPRNLFANARISKAEQMRLIKAFANFAKAAAEGCPSKDDENITHPQISLDMYVSLLIIFFLLKMISDSKEYYFDHSNETVFSQVALFKDENRRLQEENDRVKDAVNKLQLEIGHLREQVGVLEQANRKGINDVAKGYVAEISSLERQIKTLNAELEERSQSEAELYALREFAFSVRSEYVIQEAGVDLEHLLKGKRIAIIGGHINWRNNLKKKYPSITVMDGHLETADFGVLKASEFVFLNVSNMSHSVYYKVMNVLRNSSVPFDYLGRTINQELYEKEMADILLRHEMKKMK